MAIHWQIPFMSLRTSTLYTVNIYDSTYSGQPIVLKGGAQPFTTQESDDDDMFIPIRTQTGYMRIVDDGKDANGNTWNWKTLLPMTDTDRPVTLTSVHGGETVVHWHGFMQAQNFGGVLYGNPQEREFPVQCSLTVLEGTDINYQHTEIENFAYLLQRIVNCIDVVSGGTEASDGTISVDGDIHISNIYVQGSTDAQAWLMKRIDWQNFVSEDGDSALTARFNLYQCLEDMCRFWGWTARTFRNNLYLTCADDSSEQSWLTLTRADLNTMAGGTSSGTTGGSFSTLDFDVLTDIFASVDQNDYNVRGPNKATVTANGNTGNNEIIKIYPDLFVIEMTNGGTYLASGGGFGNNISTLRYTTDKTSFDTPLLEGSCRSGYATFNVMSFKGENFETQSFNVVKIKKSYASGALAFASLSTKYEHVYSGDVITLSGVVYRNGEKFEDKNSAGIGQKHMYIRIGVGKTRSSATWYVSGGIGGQVWSGTPADIQVRVGGDSEDLFKISLPEKCSGKIFLELLGSNDISEVSGERSFDLANLVLTVERNNKYYEVTTGNFASLKTKKLSDSRKYNSSNNNNVRQDWNADCVYASDNDMNFGFGVIANNDDSYMSGFDYGGFGLLTRPERHLASRVTAYWATSKRKLTTELRSDRYTSLSPMNKVTLDGTTLYPIAFGHEWRDDKTKTTFLEL